MADPDQEYFGAIPWCAKLLHEPNIVTTPTCNRQYKEDTEDALFAETLNHPDAIRACLSFYKRPDVGDVRVDEVHTLFSLGYRVNGYANVCHGGMVATLVDEAVGILLTVNKRLENAVIKNGSATASLQMTFLKPVVTPQTVLVTTTFHEVKGRKYYINVTVKNDSDVCLAEAKTLWIGFETKGKL